MPLEPGYRCPYCGHLNIFPPNIDFQSDFSCPNCNRTAEMNVVLIGYFCATMYLCHEEALVTDKRIKFHLKRIGNVLEEIRDILAP